MSSTSAMGKAPCATAGGRPRQLPGSVVRGTLTASAFALVVLLAFSDLTVSPPPWYDEGQNLQVARNLARTGAYALSYSADDVRPFDLTTGPTVIGPVALVFKTIGVGIAQGRAVMVLYVLLFGAAMYATASALYGPPVGILALLIWCASERANPMSIREVVGEGAALAYLFWATFVFARAQRVRTRWTYVVAGGLFGLAILTKGQFALVVGAIVGAWLVTRARPEGFALRDLLLLLSALVLPLIAWQLYQFALLGPAAFIGLLDNQSRTVSVSSITGLLGSVTYGAQYFQRAPVAALTLVGLVFVLLAALHKDPRRERPERLILPLFALVWLAWYLALSTGYDRYTGPLVATCSLFLAVLVHYAAAGVGVERAEEQADKGAAASVIWRWPNLGPLGLTVTLLVLVPVGLGLGARLALIARPPAAEAQQIADLIEQQVAPTAVTESLEWQLDVLVERDFHHPPPFVPKIPYEVPSTTSYLIDGPWSKLFGVYAHELEQHTYRRVGEMGEYELYARVSAATVEQQN